MGFSRVLELEYLIFLYGIYFFDALRRDFLIIFQVVFKSFWFWIFWMTKCCYLVLLPEKSIPTLKVGVDNSAAAKEPTAIWGRGGFSEKAPHRGGASIEYGGNSLRHMMVLCC